ncbi:GNAT family N-acetyltransferase [Chitinophaga barathri]|uniref:N-acetyltransferase n=1 Tax=Chitinophaga barathri TaxID=1647451 RepID=A0A3N4MDP0_9BACT|nr:GNAT family N-acetyltransferase [Chitinophaga barathri]RPD41861.1 N-acetyltransferase [Chitinophaga barathri]
MLTFQFSPFPEITTNRLVLRQLRTSDAEDMRYLRSHPELMRYIPRPRAGSLEEAVSLIKRYNASIERNESINWAMADKETDKQIGAIGFVRFKPEHYRGEVGYLLHDGWHGKGIMSEALAAVLHYGFHTLGLHSVEAVIDPENIASEKLLQKLDFVKEAHFREAEYYEGSWLDSIVYSLLTPLK